MGTSVTHARREPVRLTKLLVVCLLCAFGVGAARARAQQAPQDDTQSWNEVQITVPVRKWVDMVVYGQVRVGRDVTDPVDERGGMGFNFKLGKYLTLSPSLFHIATQPVPTRKAFENRAIFAATVRLPTFKGFTVSNRHQFERRFRDPANSTRYRNRLQVEHPWKVGGKTLRLFVADEIQYESSFDAWHRNRFAAGVGKSFNKTFAGDIYYLRQNDGRSRPGDLHVIGTLLRVRIQ